MTYDQKERHYIDRYVSEVGANPASAPQVLHEIFSDRTINDDDRSRILKALYDVVAPERVN